MDIHKLVLLNGVEPYICCYCRDWNGIPVFVTENDRNSRSAVYRDGTGFIIIGFDLLKLKNDAFLLNRLWHEVSHLYHQDAWKPWQIRYEFRADLVAAAATNKELTLERLCAAMKNADRESADELNRRIIHLCRARNGFSKRSALHMLSSIKPVHILRQSFTMKLGPDD